MGGAAVCCGTPHLLLPKSFVNVQQTSNNLRQPLRWCCRRGSFCNLCCVLVPNKLCFVPGFPLNVLLLLQAMHEALLSCVSFCPLREGVAFAIFAVRYNV